MEANKSFVVLASVKIQEKRNCVISVSPDGKFVLAQQLMVEEDGRHMAIFMKGAIKLDSLSQLYDLRDALNEAIEKIEK